MALSLNAKENIDPPKIAIPQMILIILNALKPNMLKNFIVSIL
jgi:hypothetical protein